MFNLGDYKSAWYYYDEARSAAYRAGNNDPGRLHAVGSEPASGRSAATYSALTLAFRAEALINQHEITQACETLRILPGLPR